MANKTTLISTKYLTNPIEKDTGSLLVIWMWCQF